MNKLRAYLSTAHEEDETERDDDLAARALVHFRKRCAVIAPDALNKRPWHPAATAAATTTTTTTTTTTVKRKKKKEEGEGEEGEGKAEATGRDR